MRVGAHLTGIEVEFVGTLQKRGEALYLVSQKTGQKLRLAPLTHKVQWDAKEKGPAAPTQAERDAFKTLESQFGTTLMITGPLRDGKTLEVRQVREAAR